ncbi:MAG: GGDEF domain-containing protein, partial [Planctomycetota bacterium]|nr:GGDEF domain-containing protein [Planctomycetota bacterium]
VQAIIDDDGSFHSISLSMIRAHLGTGDIHLLLPEETDDVDVRATALIECEDEHLATLVSSTVGTEDLRPWATWLSTWMTLERRMRGLETLTETDQLTGAGNRRAFERICAETIHTARQERRIVTLMVFDIDNFKSYNDQYGHEAGDEVLRETVDLLRCTIRRGDHVFRIGGDEFAVIFSDNEGPRNEQSSPPESVEDIAHRFQAKVCELRFPQLGLEAEGSLSISAGLATFPWDGHDGPSLLRHADRLAMDSKRAGKNAIRFGPGARGRCEKDGDPDPLA